MSRQVGASRFAANAFCRYSAMTCIALLAVVANHLILQLNCQRYHTTSTNSGGPPIITNSNCNHNQSREQHLRHLRQPISINRQQRQFNQLKNPKSQQQQVAEQQQQQQQQQQQPQQHHSEQLVRADSDQEEFSLALGSAGTGTQSAATQQQQNAISNYTLLPANQQATEQPVQVSNQTAIADGQVILNTTPANPSDSIVSPVVLQPPATTTSSIVSNTAPPAPEASKVNAATFSPEATTTTNTNTLSGSAQSTTSVPSTLNLDQGQGQGHLHLEEPLTKDLQHTRATGRRMEDSGAATGVSELGSASVAAGADQYQARHEDAFSNNQMYPQVAEHSHLQSVSSAPSSISIITPLIGPPTQSQSHTTSLTATIGGPPDSSHQQQQQQSAMMKPIYVVGNPISERDYGNSLYYHQYQAPAQSPVQQQQQQSQPPVSHSPATVESNQQQQQQSAMMKPIYVVGNPISERDYGNSLYYHQYQAPAQSPVQQQQQQQQSQPPVSHSPATVESNQQQSQQQQPLPPPSPQQQQPTTSGKVPKPPVETSHSEPQPVVGSSQVSQKAKSVETLPVSQHTPRFDKSQELTPVEAMSEIPQTNATAPNYSNPMGDRISGPPLVYSDGRLQSSVQQSARPVEPVNPNATGLAVSQQPASPRLFQGQPGAAVVGNNPRRPSLPPPVNQANAASGFRSPMSPSGPLLGTQQQQQQQQAQVQSQQQVGPSMNSLQPPINNLASPHMSSNFYQTASPYANTNTNNMLPLGAMYSGAPQPNLSPPTMGYNKQNFMMNTGSQQQQLLQQQQQQQQQQQALSIPSSVVPTPMPGTAPGSGRRPLNITRVEHISAECANDLIRAVIVFNGTFKGIIYSSGYVNDPTCLYVNGTGSTRYEFNIRLNQCGTLGRQELHQPTIPGEARRRDQVMWNTLSIQYNSIIEQEWDEHFRVSCEYGSDFWKTVSFSPFNVETNTGSPVVFTINPPQCQMDVLLGHGMGPKIAVDGPVTVGDPLTLLIHMKSEKAGYDILVKNCVAHNGGKQRMQLIDANGCVVNERFISPFRGTYNDNDLRHVTLYAYLKAFRFTGSPVLYLECEIHMCQSACPPQMCYWRRLSKRSVDNFDYEYTTNSSSLATTADNKLNRLAALPDAEQPIISDSLNLFKALQVRQESEPQRSRRELRQVYAEDEEAQLVCYRHAEVLVFITTMASLLVLVFTIALTCWLRVRKLTRSQFQHNRLLAASSSLSPSLLSIGDAISNAGSLIGGTGNSLLSLAAAKSAAVYPAVPVWQQQQQQQQRHHQSGASKLPPNHLYQSRPNLYHSQAAR